MVGQLLSKKNHSFEDQRGWMRVRRPTPTHLFSIHSIPSDPAISDKDPKSSASANILFFFLDSQIAEVQSFLIDFQGFHPLCER